MTRVSMASAMVVVACALLAPVSPASADPTPGQISTLRDGRITESSGLAYSGSTDKVVYTHNDEPGNPQVFAVDPTTGATVGTFGLSPALTANNPENGPRTKGDPESIRMDLTTGRLYLADTGNNYLDRTNIALYGLPEPGPGDHGTLTAARYPLAYSIGPRNAEALVIHPLTGAMYIITKEDPTSNLLSLALPLSTSGNTATRVASIEGMVTDATFTNDGRWMLVRTTGSGTQVYDPNNAWQQVDTIADTCSLPKGESITTEPGGVSFLIGSEGANSPVCRVLLPPEYRKAPFPPAAEGSVYRFWSGRFNNAHFFTMSRDEAEHIYATDSNWVFEGIAFRAVPRSAGSCSSGSPIFRFYSGRFQSHFYSASPTEADHVRTTDRNWTDEGIAYCAYLSPRAGAIRLYRFWSPNFGKHFYTASQGEADHIRATDGNWTYEGIAYYVLP